MAKKLESKLVNMILSLVLISMTMSAALSFVYLKTKGPIEMAQKQKELDAIKQVLPEFDSDPATGKTEKDGVFIYKVNKQDQPVGYAIKTFRKVAGHIEIMAVLPDGSIYNVSVLQHKETGAGTK
jgi:electron transport complex protein RnfG